MTTEVIQDFWHPSERTMYELCSRVYAGTQEYGVRWRSGAMTGQSWYKLREDAEKDFNARRAQMVGG